MQYQLSRMTVTTSGKAYQVMDAKGQRIASIATGRIDQRDAAYLLAGSGAMYDALREMIGAFDLPGTKTQAQTQAVAFAYAAMKNARGEK